MKDNCAAVDAASQWTGRLDVLVCNASAINLDPEPSTKAMDLLHHVNVSYRSMRVDICPHTVGCLP